jgi:hypothetical protein
MYINPWLYIVHFLKNFIFNEKSKFPKFQKNKLYILLMHVIEYYFCVNWSLKYKLLLLCKFSPCKLILRKF